MSGQIPISTVLDRLAGDPTHYVGSAAGLAKFPVKMLKDVAGVDAKAAIFTGYDAASGVIDWTPDVSDDTKKAAADIGNTILRDLGWIYQINRLAAEAKAVGNGMFKARANRLILAMINEAATATADFARYAASGRDIDRCFRIVTARAMEGLALESAMIDDEYPSRLADIMPVGAPISATLP